ncbi:hypothetical protein D0Y65_049245 [Glycine soja]|uniref:Uncharacterized protein n=1 Tax=Glycine soja TaxID=3848 RepID=A0A445FW43_GLYSO|nr:hypothetical protein D0Y65_049245 [Glycine soja]
MTTTSISSRCFKAARCESPYLRSIAEMDGLGRGASMGLGLPPSTSFLSVKLCLGDLLVMGSNPETASLHMQGKGCVQHPSPIPSHSEEPLGNGINMFKTSRSGSFSFLGQCLSFIVSVSAKILVRNAELMEISRAKELVTQFEDHQFVTRLGCNTNNTYITRDQDFIISYCKADSDDQWMEGNGNRL